MDLIRNLDELPDAWRGGAVAVGNYDGVHGGHARIVERLLAMARRLGGPAVVFTFDPQPAHLLRPDHAPALLTWTERKVQLLADLGVQCVVAYPTDEAFLQLTADEFFDRIVRGRLGARGMVEGTNFFFGRQRQGDVSLLGHLCDAAGIALEVVQPVQIDGAPVSSSRIRRLLAEGRIDQSRRMLTAPHRVRGTVIQGARRGQTLGYPTVNLTPPDTLLPCEGIYAGRAWADGGAWPAAISIGPNPTFGENSRKIEAHLAGYSGSLYGQVVEVDFLARLRDIKRFDSVDQLVAQMADDVAVTRRIAEEVVSSTG